MNIGDKGMNLGDKSKQSSYLICSLSENLFICSSRSGKFDTTTKMDEAKIFKTRASASNILIGMKNNIRKRASGWKVISVKREFYDDKIKYTDTDKNEYQVSEDIIEEFSSLCEHYDTLAELNDNLKSIYSKKRKFIDLLEMYDRQQCDILHKIEFEKFNACQGYTLSKSIKNLREKRRQVKNALKFIDRTENSKDISIIISEINNLQNQKYCPRISYENQ